jgi:START domain-containing protein
MRAPAAPIWIAALLCGLTLASSSAAEPPAPTAWQTVRSEKGIIVSKKDVPGSSLMAFRGEGDIDAPILAVGSVLIDDTQTKEWVDNVVEVRVLRRISDVEQVTYLHIATPFVMSDRDSVMRAQVTVDAASKSLVLRAVSVDDPLAPKTGRVRVQVDASSFTLTSVDGGKRTHVVAEVHCDPRGNVPGWVVNTFQKSWGFNTLENLRKQVRKSRPNNAALRARLGD